MRLLIVEDESALRSQLTERFRKNGFAVDEARDGEEGLYFGKEYPVDIAVIDLGLPKIGGIEVIRQLRESGVNYPILILTARSRWQEKVEGLEAGADDYLAKPFHFEELQARVSALIRRSAGQSNPVLENGPIALDTRTQDVTVSGQPLDLTAFEYRLLYYLMLNVGKVVSKMELTEHLYDEDADRDSNVIEVFIGRLRKKIDPEGAVNPIETLRGRGYRFTAID
ncbi:MAG: response regulator transcription factor [Pseudomonadota bacterium]